jgi:iron complex outermembrane receptor protein
MSAAPVMAQEAEAEQEASEFDTIVVTAQFREQNLQDTPVAITAITGEMLEARGQQSVQEIAAQAPNVTLTAGGSFAGPSLIGFIRGVGQTDFNPALEPGVGLYVDDVYYSTLTGSLLDLLDLDRIEVLRGPQGTLSGKNSIGGAIRLFSQRPDEEANGYIEASVGELNSVGIRAASNFTLMEDRLYARVSGVSRSRDGHVTNLDYTCTHPGSIYPAGNILGGCETGAEGGIDYTAARLALRWLPSDNLEVNLSADFVDDNSEAAANVLLGAAGTRAPVFYPTPGAFAWDFSVAAPNGSAIPIVAGLGCQFIAYGPASCDPNSPNNPYVNYSTYTDLRTGVAIPREQTLDAKGVTLNIDWDIAEGLQLQSITGYRELESSFGTDYDGSPVPVAMLYQTVTHDQISQEFRLNGGLGLLDYTLGAFYFDANTDLVGRIDLGYVGFDFIHGPDPVSTTNWAVFANGIFRFTDDLELAAGVRYSEDEKEYRFQRRNPDLSSIQPCIGPPGTPGNPPNCLISSLNGVTSTFQDERVDYRVALSYHFTPDIMAYVQYSTGYKGGGVNPRPFYNVQAVTFQPEELTATELGFKSELFDVLRLNGAIFFNDYTDIQLTLNSCTGLFPAPFDAPCLANTNAGDAEVQGAELEFDFMPFEGLSIDGSISYLDFEYQNLDPRLAALGYRGRPQVPQDGITPYTPEVKWSLGVEYEFTGAYGSITPRIDASYQDDVFTEPHNSQQGMIEAYTLVNGRITWRAPDDTWSLALEGRNLTDELYYTSTIDSVEGYGGLTYGSPGLPRTFAVIVRRNF